MPIIPEGAHRIEIPGYTEYVGKVRHTYELDNENMLMVASDRISTFDSVHPTRIDGKGKVLTQLSVFMFHKIVEALGIEHHMITAETDEIIDRYPALELYTEQINARSMLVKKGSIVPIEGIVRGNIAGSYWKKYLQSNIVHGITFPKNLQQCQELEEPVFTPSTKAADGHDINLSFEEACDLVGRPIMEEMREKALLIFIDARAYAKERGIILADTKFEFMNTSRGLKLADEVLTPDSSRLWPLATFEPGHDQESFDKQFVRNYVESIGWNKLPPAPELPSHVVDGTCQRYGEAYRILTGLELSF